jgi:PAS domain S-box-containing protein
MSSTGVDARAELRPAFGAVSVIAVGIFTALIPIYDMWDDVLAGKSLLSTTIENSPLLGLSAAVVIGGVQLYRTQWGPKYIHTIVTWMLSSAAFVTVLFVFIIAIQQYLQDELKPLIIAADAVVVAALGGLLIGVRTAERERVEENRFDALFDNLPNPVAETEFEDGTTIARRINPAFTDVFGFEQSEIVGEPLEEYIVPPGDDIDPVEKAADGRDSPVDVLDQETIELETIRGRREFIRLTVPGEADGANGYGIYIDVTSQKQRQERLAVLARILRHDIRNRVSVILGYTQYLADHVDESDVEKIERIDEAASELASISERTRIAEDLAVESTDQRAIRLRPTVEAAFEELSEITDTARIDLNVPEGVCVRATTDLGMAITEIVENAIVHNGASTPEIEITAERTYDGEYYELRIEDDGPGIDPSLYEVVIGERERSKVDHSNGLGIWLAYWVCRASGGELEFESDDGGTAVILRVPATDCDGDAVVSHPHSSRRPDE